MKNSDIMMITADAEKIPFNQNELAHRLGVARGYSDELIVRCTEKLKNIVDFKCVYIRTPVIKKKENICDFGFMSVESRNLYNNLKGCSEVFAMALTTGIAVDRELAKLRITSRAEYFVTDGIASAAIDSFADYASAKMRGDKKCPPRFSPGYGDFSLTFQRPFLERLGAHALLGITLDSSCMMTPIKSITAIMGIKDEENN